MSPTGLRQPRFLWQARLMQTAQAVFRGALDDAEFFADRGARARAAGGAGRAKRSCSTPSRLLEIARWQGRLDEHVEQLRPFAGQPSWDFGYRDHALPLRGRRRRSTRPTSTARIVGRGFLPLRRDMLVAPSLYNFAFLADA